MNPEIDNATKPHVFSSFMKSVNFFKNEMDSHKEKLKRELEQEIDDLITDRNSLSLGLFVNRGYMFTKKQALAVMDNNIGGGHNPTEDELLIKHNVYQVFKKEIQPEIMQKLNQIEGVLNRMIPRENKAKKVQILWDDYKQSYEYFNKKMFETIFSDDNFVLEFIDVAKKIKRAVTKELDKPYKQTDSQSYHLACHTLERINDDVSRTCHYLENEKKELVMQNALKKLDKYDALFQDIDIKDHMMIEVTNTIKNFNEKDLPENIQKIIGEIKNTYKELAKQQLPLEQQLEINNLYKKRFPQVLEEYILIPESYKEKMINQDIKALLLDSLTEINKKLTQVSDQLHDNNHKQMKITNRYLKST